MDAEHNADAVRSLIHPGRDERSVSEIGMKSTLKFLCRPLVARRLDDLGDVSRTVLEHISDHHDLNAGIYASVTRPGTITVGDVVTVH